MLAIFVLLFIVFLPWHRIGIRQEKEGRMKSLSNDQRNALLQQRRMVREWLDRSDRELERGSKRHFEGDGFLMLGWFLLAVSAVAALCMTCSIFDKGSLAHWWLAAPLGCFMVGLVMRHIGRKTSDEATKILRAELDRERQSDPMYVRAKTLIEATKNYLIHRDRYLACYLGAEAGVQEVDEETAEIYFSFLQTGHGVLRRAMENFENVYELTARWQGRKTVAEPQDAALSDLLARLDQPTEIPSLPVVPDLRRVLEYEDALVELNEELASQEFCLQRR